MGLAVGEVEQHYTNPNPEIETLRRRTVPGMAHFATTGPSGTTCRECAFWTGCGAESGYYAGKKNGSRGLIKPRKCEKFRQMMGGAGAAVPYSAGSCKYFEPNLTPPPIETPR